MKLFAWRLLESFTGHVLVVDLTDRAVSTLASCSRV
jgi:hypothetical protein